MIRQFYPTKDATIYEHTPLLNTGLDQILELNKTDYDNSRILIQFDTDEITKYISDNNIQTYNCKLKLTSIDSREIPLEYDLFVHPITQYWSMGTGKKDIMPSITTNVNWIYRTATELWEGDSCSLTGSINDFYNLYNCTGILTSSYYGEMDGYFTGIVYSGSVLIESDNIYRYFLVDTFINELLLGRFTGEIEGIYSGSIIAAISGSVNINYYTNFQGGSFNQHIYSTQSFDYELCDTDVDITNILNDWISGSYSNNGLLIKLSDTEESQSNHTTLQFYSKDTHTIYPPKLELYWDDSNFITSASINEYTMSYTVHTYQQSKTPLSDLSFAYVNFDVPILPRYATYETEDSWSYQLNQISESRADYVKTYLDNYYIQGNIIANFNGQYIGDITGSITGSNVSGGYMELSGSVNEMLNGKLIATTSGTFLGFMDGYIHNKVSSFEYYLTGSRTYYITESIDLKPLTKSNIIVYIKNPIMNYSEGSINEIRLIGRERFPNKTYWSRTSYADIKYLPSSSYYSIKDAQTDDIVIPFDDTATKISCDEDGNYFTLDTNGFQTERMYRFVFKVIRNNMVQYFDDNFLFKVIR